MPAPPSVPYGTSDFDSLLSRISTLISSGAGVMIIFEQAPDEARQLALGQLAEHTGLSLHQVNLGTLYDERPMVAQGNLRESFDSAGESPSILAFDHADHFFDLDRQQGEEEDRDEDALTPVDYLFQRAEAFKGVLVLALRRPDYNEQARNFADFVVTF